MMTRGWLPALIMIMLLTGCAWRSPADPARGDLHPPPPLPSDAWPVRVADPLPLVPRPDELMAAGTGEAWAASASARTEGFVGIFGLGAVSYLDEPDDDFENERDAPLAFQVLLARDGEDTDQQEVKLELPSGTYKAVAPPQAAVCRINFLLFPPSEGGSRGLVVHLPSLMESSSYEWAVAQTLRQRGWAVLRVGHPTSLWEQRAYVIVGGGEPAQVAMQFAHAADDLIADWALGVESALEFLEAEHPEITQEHRVLLGVSLGTLALPAVAARQPDAFDAAVVVAGGADLTDLCRNVALTNGRRTAGLFLQLINDPTPEEWQTFHETYLQTSHLDPAVAGAYLRGMPVLQLHAIFDQVIPARLGDLLHERLGRPERWSYPLGHFGLIWWLPQEAKAIARWIDQATVPAAITTDNRAARR